MPTVWKIDAKNVSTKTVIEWCLKTHQVNRMVIGISMCINGRRNWRREPCNYQQIKNAHRFFGGFVLAKLSVGGIPGTDFCGGRCPALVIEFNEEVAERVISLGPRLTDWDSGNDPSLPRDLYLYRNGASFPNLVTVAHEGEAWLVSDQAVRIRGVAQTSLQPKEIYVHHGSHFCKRVKGSRFPFMKRFKPKIA